MDGGPAAFQRDTIKKLLEKLGLFSYTKSLMAGGIALLAVVCAGLWLQNRAIVLAELTQAGHDLTIQAAGSETYPAVIADYVKRLETLQADNRQITGKFVGPDYEAPRMMSAIVTAASQAGMEMTDASKQDKKANVLAGKSQVPAVQALSYAITLKGSYTALVKFFQNLAAWKIGHKIESVEIKSASEGKPDDEIEVSIVLSVFSVGPPADKKIKLL